MKNLESEETLPQILAADLEDLNSYISDLMATIAHPIYTINSVGIIVDGNKALMEFTGYPLEELLGKRFYSIFADEAEAKNIEKQTVEKGYVKGEELTVLTKDGEKSRCAYLHVQEQVIQGMYPTWLPLWTLLSASR